LAASFTSGSTTNVADGKGFVVCKEVAANLAVAIKCNGGSAYNDHSGNTTDATKIKAITDRLLMKVNGTENKTIGTTATALLQVNSDIVVAAFYHAHDTSAIASRSYD